MSNSFEAWRIPAIYVLACLFALAIAAGLAVYLFADLIFTLTR